MINATHYWNVSPGRLVNISFGRLFDHLLSIAPPPAIEEKLSKQGLSAGHVLVDKHLGPAPNISKVLLLLEQPVSWQ